MVRLLNPGYKYGEKQKDEASRTETGAEIVTDDLEDAIGEFGIDEDF